MILQDPFSLHKKNNRWLLRRNFGNADIILVYLHKASPNVEYLGFQPDRRSTRIFPPPTALNLPVTRKTKPLDANSKRDSVSFLREVLWPDGYKVHQSINQY